MAFYVRIIVSIIVIFHQCRFLNFDFIYPSGRVAVCQSYSASPWGGMYTNIFSDLPNQVILGTFTPFGCGSISFRNGYVRFQTN